MALLGEYFAGECRWQEKFREGVLKEFYLDNKFSFLWHKGKKKGHLANLGMQIVNIRGVIHWIIGDFFR